MKFDLRVSIAVALALLTAAPTAYAQSADLSDKLAAPESFAGIATPRRARRHCLPSSAKC